MLGGKERAGLASVVRLSLSLSTLVPLCNPVLFRTNFCHSVVSKKAVDAKTVSKDRACSAFLCCPYHQAPFPAALTVGSSAVSSGVFEIPYYFSIRGQCGQMNFERVNSHEISYRARSFVVGAGKYFIIFYIIYNGGSGKMTMC